MRCLACNVILNKEEQQRKYTNHEDIKNPEDRYLGLCDCCLGIGTDDDLSDDFDIIEDEDDETL
jgi:hypothetical protein